MDTDITEDQRALLDVSARFMEATCPLTAVRDAEQRDGAFDEAYRRQAAELGWFSMLVPEEMGGGSISDNGVFDAALLAYKRGALLQPGSFVGTNVAAWAIATAGSDELCQKVLPALVNGEVSASWALAGPTHGGPGTGVTASTASGGGLELSGTKMAVQDVEASSWLLVTFASPQGTAQALVAADAPGVTITALDSLDISRRFFQVDLEGVTVEAASVIGSPGEIDGLLDDQLAIAATLIAAESVGAMDHEFEMTLEYSKDRIAFGRPIGSFQAIKHLLADTSLAVEMGKAVVVAAARSLGDPNDDYGTQAASIAKSLVGDSAIELAQNCFQIFGGIGYTWEHDQHLYLRRLTTDAGLYGDAAWHREHLCQLAGI